VNKTEKDIKLFDDAVDVRQAASEDVKAGVKEEPSSFAPGEEDGAADARGIKDI
jgi:hypothetical protein